MNVHAGLGPDVGGCRERIGMKAADARAGSGVGHVSVLEARQSPSSRLVRLTARGAVGDPQVILGYSPWPVDGRWFDLIALRTPDLGLGSHFAANSLFAERLESGAD